MKSIIGIILLGVVAGAFGQGDSERNWMGDFSANMNRMGVNLQRNMAHMNRNIQNNAQRHAEHMEQVRQKLEDDARKRAEDMERMRQKLEDDARKRAEDMERGRQKLEDDARKREEDMERIRQDIREGNAQCQENNCIQQHYIVTSSDDDGPFTQTSWSGRTSNGETFNCMSEERVVGGILRHTNQIYYHATKKMIEHGYTLNLNDPMAKPVFIGNSANIN